MKKLPNEDNKIIIGGDSDQGSYLELIDIEKECVTQEYIEPEFNFSCLDVQNSLISVGTNKGKLFLYDVKIKRNFCNKQLGNIKIKEIKFQPQNGSLLAGCYGDRLAVFDTSQLEINAINLGHDNDIMSIEWNEQGDKLYSGGIDKKIIQWTKNLDQIDIKKMPISIRMMKRFNIQGQEMLGLGGNDKNDFLTIWPTNNFAFPKYIIKSIKDVIINFTYDQDFNYLITGNKNEEKPIKIYKLQNYKQKYSFINYSLTVDQNNKLSFMTGDYNYQNFSLLTCDLNDYSSILQDHYPFKTIKEELLFYIKNQDYIMEHFPNDIIESLNHFEKLLINRDINVSQKILFLKEIYLKYNTLKKQPKKQSIIKKEEDRLKNFLLSKSQEDYKYFFNNLQQQKIIIDSNQNTSKPNKKEYVIHIKNDEKQYFYNQINKNQNSFIKIDQQFLSQTIQTIIQELLDQSYLIGFILYQILKESFIVDERIGVRWENDYIEILRDQELHVYATEVINSSPHKFIQNLNTYDTGFVLKCRHCDKILPGNNYGQCLDCKGIYICDYCDDQMWTWRTFLRNIIIF